MPVVDEACEPTTQVKPEDEAPARAKCEHPVFVPNAKMSTIYTPNGKLGPDAAIAFELLLVL